MIPTAVLIIGGGPVGLTLALCLSQQGIASIIVNERTGTTTHPKLDVVNCRSMEIYRQLGLAERIRDAGNPRDANQFSAFAASASGPFYTVMADRHWIYQPVTAANAAIRSCNDGSLPLETMQRIAQMHLEPVLLEAARADRNVDVRFGQRLFGFEQDAAGVSALVHDVATGDPLQIRADYMVGCDGPNSRVRNFLNIDYDGTRDLLGELFIIHVRSDDIAALFPNREPYWHTWLARPGFSGLLVSPDAGRNDYVIHRPYAPRGDETLDGIVAAAIGTKVRYEIVQSSGWRPQFLVAGSYGRGRVWMAGDSVHQYMPTGGLGMNTGIAEAHNLAWKLAARLHGWGGDRLVASYGEERLPIARRNRDHVKTNAAAVFESQFPKTDALLDDTPAGAANRAEMAAVFEAKVSRLYECMGIEIGYRYVGSRVVVADADPAPRYESLTYLPTTWAGARLPSGFRDDGTAVFDLLDARGFTLLVCGDDRSADIDALQRVAAKVGLPLRTVCLTEPHLARIYERKYILVRPDQHVAWRGDALPSDPHALLDTVRGA